METEAMLRAKLAAIRGIVGAEPAVTVQDADGRVVMANQAACELMSCDESWLLGKRGEDFGAVYPDGTAAADDDRPSVRAIRAQRAVTTPLGLTNRNGQTVWVEMTATSRPGVGSICVFKKASAPTAQSNIRLA